MSERKEYSPRWAPHVKGWYEDREVDPETGAIEAGKVGARCAACGESFGPMVCATGLFRGHIARFAGAHDHQEVKR